MNERMTTREKARQGATTTVIKVQESSQSHVKTVKPPLHASGVSQWRIESIRIQHPPGSLLPLDLFYSFQHCATCEDYQYYQQMNNHNPEKRWWAKGVLGLELGVVVVVRIDG
jgi:hypothetical protein